MTLDAEDIKALAVALAAELRTAPSRVSPAAPAPSPASDLSYSTAEMMVKLRCPPKAKGRFWATVHDQRVPFTRINSRKVIFYRGPVDAWLEKRARNAVTA